MSSSVDLPDFVAQNVISLTASRQSTRKSAIQGRKQKHFLTPDLCLLAIGAVTVKNNFIFNHTKAALLVMGKVKLGESLGNIL
jgi:hypothetical protein